MDTYTRSCSKPRSWETIYTICCLGLGMLILPCWASSSCLSCIVLQCVRYFVLCWAEWYGTPECGGQITGWVRLGFRFTSSWGTTEGTMHLWMPKVVNSSSRTYILREQSSTHSAYIAACCIFIGTKLVDRRLCTTFKISTNISKLTKCTAHCEKAVVCWEVELLRIFWGVWVCVSSFQRFVTIVNHTDARRAQVLVVLKHYHKELAALGIHNRDY